MTDITADEPAEVLNARASLRDVEVLTRRAFSILGGQPYRCGVENEEFARLRFVEDDEVELSWLEPGFDYGIDTESVRFPAHLLFLGADEFAIWQRNEVAKRALEDARIKARRQAQLDASERAQYEQLKKKYG